MGIFDIFSSSPSNPKDKIKVEKGVHDRKIESLKKEIEKAKKQIESLKAETNRLRKAGMLNPLKRDYQKKRTEDWKKTIQRRKDDIVRENKIWKSRYEYLKNQK